MIQKPKPMKIIIDYVIKNKFANFMIDNEKISCTFSTFEIDNPSGGFSDNIKYSKEIIAEDIMFYSINNKVLDMDEETYEEAKTIIEDKLNE